LVKKSAVPFFFLDKEKKIIGKGIGMKKQKKSCKRRKKENM
jgi:hypothetical protein